MHQCECWTNMELQPIQRVPLSPSQQRGPETFESLGIKNKRDFCLVIAWRWRLSKGRGGCQGQVQSWRTKMAEVAQGDPKQAGRRGEIKKCGFVEQMQNLFLGEDSLSARQSMTVINEGGILSQAGQRFEQQSETFALLFTAFEPWYFKTCFFCLNSHRDVQAGANLSFNRQFYDEHWSKHRVVTCMDWSLQVRCEAAR